MTRLSDIRKQIQKQRGIEFKKHSRKVIPIEETPSLFPKTNLMRLIELKFKDRLENLIFKGTIYEVEKLLGVDASTISKWRRLIEESYYAQFSPLDDSELRQLQKNRRRK